MRARVGSLLCILAIVGLTPVVGLAADADQQMKPGLWQADTRAGGLVATVSMCIGESWTDTFSQMRVDHPSMASARGGSCSPLQTRRFGDRTEEEMTCGAQGHETRMLLTRTGDDTHVHIVNSLTVNGVEQPAPSMEMRWAGQCPSGLKPGQSRVTQTSVARR